MRNLYLACLLRPVPLALIAAGVAAGAALGSTLAAAVGITLGAAVAGFASLDPARRAQHRLERTPGIDPATIAGVRATRERLARLRTRPGVGREAQRGLDQIDACNRGVASFAQVLDARFARAELTYGRYLESARQVYLAALDRIGRAATALEAVAALDAPRLRAELRQHERRADQDTAAIRRGDALRDQVAALETGLEDARVRLADAEQAVGELAAAAGALSRVETQHRLAAGEPAESVRELRALAERAALYALPGRDE